MEKVYNPHKTESEIYKLWEKNKVFTPKIISKRKPFVVMIPPPNVTGSLHMGHALNNTIQDILVRYHRMKGGPTLWLPGTDHAGIATQNVVEKELHKEGKTRHDLGRKEFVERVWKWKEKYGHIIIDQLKKLGCSCDFTRERFTMDKGYVDAVEEAFRHYFKKGLIYRGNRIVNWCPRCASAISDIEVKYKEEKGKLWYIKYKIKNQKTSASSAEPSKIKNFITVATTRPETMLGDTGVAVNPKDRRYKDLIGKKVILPLMNREIPIVADSQVDIKFGTGALKVTPAHDALDYEIGEKNNLKAINVIGEDGKMTKEAGKFKNLSVSSARKAVLADLEKQDRLEKEKDFSHSLALCDRCDTPIEPLISRQWFVKMKPLAGPAIRVVKKGKIKFIPKRWTGVYLDWMENIKDWCISRQLWWGHQIPVWYCGRCLKEAESQKGASGNQKKSKIKNQKSKLRNGFIFLKKPKKCPVCKGTKIKREKDVLDTWFSSALWPLATLGWPQEARDLKYFYPTTFLSTARDIIYLWVARMIMSGLEFRDEIPFHDVFIHATVLDIEGRRMSKSLGTGVDPLDLVKKYGADATRFGLIYQMSFGQQDIRFSEDTLRASRNFANKVWNIARYIKRSVGVPKDTQSLKLKNPSLADKWILSGINKLVSKTTKLLKAYRLGEAAHEIYEFTWHSFADLYLEYSKKEKNEEVLWYVLDRILRLLHPFMPHLTESIWLEFRKGRTKIKKEIFLAISKWPKVKQELIVSNRKEEKAERLLRETILSPQQYRREKARRKKEQDRLKKIIVVKEKELQSPDFQRNAPKEIIREKEDGLLALKQRLRDLSK